MEGTHVWAVNEELQHIGRTQKFIENSRGRDPTLEQGKSVKSTSHEDEAAAEKTCDDLSTILIPSPCIAARREVEIKRAKLNAGRGVEGRYFKDFILFLIYLL